MATTSPSHSLGLSIWKETHWSTRLGFLSSSSQTISSAVRGRCKLIIPWAETTTETGRTERVAFCGQVVFPLLLVSQHHFFRRVHWFIGEDETPCSWLFEFQFQWWTCTIEEEQNEWAAFLLALHAFKWLSPRDTEAWRNGMNDSLVQGGDTIISAGWTDRHFPILNKLVASVSSGYFKDLQEIFKCWI